MNESEQQLMPDHIRIKLSALGISIPEGLISIDHFGDSPELFADLLSLIASGKNVALQTCMQLMPLKI